MTGGVDAWLQGVAAWSAVGASSGAGFFFAKWLVEYVGGRMDRRAEALDASTQRLIEGLEKRVCSLTERVETVERELVDCKHMHAVAEAETMRLKAIIQGSGEVREQAARIIAAEKYREEQE